MTRTKYTQEQILAVLREAEAGDQHLPSEWYDNAEGPLGIVRALLVTAAVAEVVA